VAEVLAGVAGPIVQRTAVAATVIAAVLALAAPAAAVGELPAAAPAGAALEPALAVGAVAPAEPLEQVVTPVATETAETVKRTAQPVLSQKPAPGPPQVDPPAAVHRVADVVGQAKDAVGAVETPDLGPAAGPVEQVRRTVGGALGAVEGVTRSAAAPLDPIESVGRPEPVSADRTASLFDLDALGLEPPLLGIERAVLGLSALHSSAGPLAVTAALDRSFQSASAQPPAAEVGGRPETPSPRKVSAPAAGGAAAASSSSLFVPLLALLVLAALAAPRLVRRFDGPPDFLRLPSFVCALERPG
jgi:hypothetical protein